MAIPTTMKAVVVHEPGDANNLVVETTYPVPTLEPGQVLIKNDFAGINFIDTYHRKGLYPRTYPFVAGQEGGGVVVKTASDDASNFKVADRVTYLSFGSYAEYTAVPESKVVPLPDDMKMDIAISCMTQGLTAHYLVTSAHANLISKGEWCLIYAIGSGTCQWAAQMAKLQGFKVIGTCSKGKKEAATQHCDELIVLEEATGASYADYTTADIAAKVMDITGGVGAKCVIDGVGKSTVDISLDCLAPRGIFISFGNASGAVPAFPVLRLVKKSTFVTRPKLNEYMATREEFMMRVKEVFDYVKSGELNITVDKVFELDNAVEGHKYLEGGNSRGKLLYKI